MEDKGLIETIQDSFVNLGDEAVDFIPKLLAAILLIVVGLFVAQFVAKWVKQGLSYVESKKGYKSTLKSLGLEPVNFSNILTILARWTILIIFLSAAIDVFAVSVLTDTFEALIDFIPNLFAAVVIAGLSLLAGNVVKDIVSEAAKNANIAAWSQLAMAAKVLVLVFGIPLAATQLGLDLSIITNNITVIVAGIMLAFGLAFGLGGRDVAGRIIEDLYDSVKRS